PPDGPASEVALHEACAGNDDRDREAPVAYLDLVGHFQRGGVKELQHVVVEQAYLTGAVTGAQHARELARPGEGRRAVGTRIVDHVQGQVPAQAHRRPGIVVPGRLRYHDVIAGFLDLDERDPWPEVVRDARVRDVHLARMDAGPVQRAPEPRVVVAPHRVGEPVTVDPGHEADARV